VKNPCIDPAYIVINQTPLPAGKQYILHDYKIAGGYTFTHDPFTIVTSPITHTMCGGLTYTATFNGSPINTTTKTSTGMAYNTTSLTFEIYSENFGLLGDKTFTLAAYLTNYPVTVSSKPDSQTIKIINPCLNPFSLNATAQTNPPDYYYSSNAYPKVQVTLAQYVVDPAASVCPITYSCSVSGPRTDICSITDGATVANFNPVTGNYDFKSIDMAKYPVGAYKFMITGTVGAKSVAETFVMTLVDPCPTTTLTIK